jgi:hypothetical protein
MVGVGMERMPKRAATDCTLSVFSFAKRAFSANEAALSSNAGAIILHGPHHDAQKSTTTGISLFATWLSKDASSRSIGFVSRSDPWHLPQLAFV